jgi:hypothetical protein
VTSKADNDPHEAQGVITLVRLRIFLSLTSHNSSATCEISPSVNTEMLPMRLNDGESTRRTEIMRDDNHTALKFLDGGGKSIN